MMLQPVRASCSIARSLSLSGMFSRKVVASTLSPSALAAARRALVVLIGIAEIADRAGVNPTGLHLAGRLGAAGGGK